MGILSRLKQRRINPFMVDKPLAGEEKKEEKEEKEESKEPIDNVQIKEVSNKKRGRKSKKEDIDIAVSLATYIVAFEILTAMYFEEDDDFVKLYDQFRKEWKIEELINKVKKYDILFRAVYKEVDKWLNQ